LKQPSATETEKVKVYQDVLKSGFWQRATTENAAFIRTAVLVVYAEK